MPEGLQDWYLRNQINIIAQDVAELIQRPKYGAGQAIDISVNCPASETTILATVNAKGVIYWGHLYIDGTVSHNIDQALLFLEGDLIVTQSFWTLRARVIYAPWRESMYILGFDEINYEYSVGISPGNTFESQIELRYNNKSDEDVKVNGRLVYAII